MDKEKAFQLRIGKGKVIPGWEQGSTSTCYFIGCILHHEFRSTINFYALILPYPFEARCKLSELIEKLTVLYNQKSTTTINGTKVKKCWLADLCSLSSLVEVF